MTKHCFDLKTNEIVTFRGSELNIYWVQSHKCLSSFLNNKMEELYAKGEGLYIFYIYRK